MRDRLPAADRFEYGACALIFVISGLDGGATLYSGRHDMHPEPTVATIWVWIGVTVLAYLAALVCVAITRQAVVRRFENRRTAAVARNLLNVAVGMAIGVGRSACARWVFGHPLDAPRSAMLALNFGYSFAALLVCFRHTAEFRGRQTDLDHALDRLRHDVEDARADLVDGDEVRRRQAAELLHGDVQMRLLLAWDRVCLADLAPRIEQARVARLLEEAGRHLDHALSIDLEKVRGALSDPQEDKGLIAGLERLAARFAPVLPLHVALAPPGGMDVHLPDDTIETALRLTQEALLNVLRHSQARSVHLRLDIDAQGVWIEVEDDGIGFAPLLVDKGLGLSEVGRSLGSSGGSWRVSSAPGRGTRLEIRLCVTDPVLARELA